LNKGIEFSTKNLSDYSISLDLISRYSSRAYGANLPPAVLTSIVESPLLKSPNEGIDGAVFYDLRFADAC
jgi:hypothetical protein